MGDSVTERGRELHQLLTELYPICRSITGDGLRRSLELLGRWVPAMIQHEVPTGTPVLDWTVPREWNLREAWIRDAQGRVIVDAARHNLHVLNYSMPVRTRLKFAELRNHLFSLPDRPDWIPYRTSYYRETWGFCLAHRQLLELEQAGPGAEYDVCVEASLAPGHLTYGEFLHRGESEAEVLISAHSCHPSLANDNLSGMVVAARLAADLATQRTRYSYRFLWAPGTIGAITWLARNEAGLGRIGMGLVLSCVGDPGPFTYKQSRRGDAVVDRLVPDVLEQSGVLVRVRPFTPLGYDERQFGSPGINLPVGCLLRTPNGEYPEYHSSADNPGLVTPAALGETLEQLQRIVEAVEDLPQLSGTRQSGGVDGAGADGAGDEREVYLNLCPKGEPQLGRRGLYRATGGTSSPRAEEALLWVLNFSDGRHGLEWIATRSGLEPDLIRGAAERLREAGVLKRLA